MGVWYHTIGQEAAWAAAAAEALATEIRHALARRERPLIAVAGGRTPAAILSAFIRMELPWSRLVFTPTDDRKLPDGHPARNSLRLRSWLAPVLAEGAEFRPLEAVCPVAAPDVVLLGFGADGHVASIFRSGEGMETARKDRSDVIAYVTPDLPSPESPLARITFTNWALLNPKRIILAGAGPDKIEALDRASLADPGESPLAGLLAQQITPVSAFVCSQTARPYWPRAADVRAA
jgi:6-phosphogluconolactonase